MKISVGINWSAEPLRVVSWIVPILLVANLSAEESKVIIAANQLPSGNVVIRLTNNSANPIVVDRLLQLFTRITLVNEKNTAIPMQEVARMERWSEEDRAGRLIQIAPGKAIEREIQITGNFWVFVGASSIPDGRSFVYEAEVKVPTAVAPTRLNVDYGVGRFESESLKFTGVGRPVFDGIYMQPISCSVDIVMKPAPTPASPPPIAPK